MKTKSLVASSVTTKGTRVLRILQRELKTTNSPYEITLIKENIYALNTLILSGNKHHVNMIAKSYGLIN